MGAKQRTPTPQNAVRMRNVAPRKAGVSVSAVSLALRNQPRVSEAERERIQAIVPRLGYRRDPEVARLMEAPAHRALGTSWHHARRGHSGT